MVFQRTTTATSTSITSLTRFLLFFAATSSSTTVAQNILDMTPSSIPASTDVQYVCTLTDLWTGARHPVDYPFGRAHWSPPVAVMHNTDYTMWGGGRMATPGLELVAETGQYMTLRDEITNFEPARATGPPVVGEQQFESEQTLPPVQANSNWRYLSIATMVAPSPDWFTGINSFNAVSPVNDNWYGSFSIETFPWDAGTEEGITYDLDNAATSPQQPISELTENTAPSTVNGVLLNPEGNDVLPVARFDCVLDMDQVPCNFFCRLLSFLDLLFGFLGL